MPHQPVRAGLLLKLPGGLEDDFWSDGTTIKVYTTLDCFTATAALLGGFMSAKAVAIRRGADGANTPDVLVHYLANLAACTLTLVVILCMRRTYTRHRHTIAAANRLLRLACLVVSGVTRTEASLAVASASLRTAPGRGRSEVAAALINLTRPVLFTGILAMGQGDWVFRLAWWLPVQVATLLVVHGAFRLQPCMLAADPFAARIARQACASLADVQQLMLAPLLGARMLWGASKVSMCDRMCGDVLTAVRLLACFTHVAYAFLIPVAANGVLEWRCKARFVASRLGHGLAYGPLGGPIAPPPPSQRSSTTSSSSSAVDSRQQPENGSHAHAQQSSGAGDGGAVRSWLLSAYLWLMGVVFVLWMLWHAVLLVVPSLPAPQCTTPPYAVDACAASGTLPSTPLGIPCDGGLLCQDPGLVAAAVLFAQVVAAACFKVVWMLLLARP